MRRGSKVGSSSRKMPSPWPPISSIWACALLVLVSFSFLSQAGDELIGFLPASVITKVGAVGRHVEFVKQSDPSGLVGWAQCLFAFEIIYFISIALPKQGIILMYLRLFVWKGTLRTISWLLFGLVTATSMSLVISACFQCIPLAFWVSELPPCWHDGVRHEC